MKKLLLAIGLAMCLLIFSSCVRDIEYIEDTPKYTLLNNTDYNPIVSYFSDGVETRLKHFNPPTKAVVHPSWVPGNKISVYSIDTDSTIICISVCEVYDIHNNSGTIDAVVAEECIGYFAAFPSYLFDYQLGDKIDLSEDKGMSGQISLSNLHYSGEFGDACVMTSWCDWCEGDGHFKFNPRSSIIKFTGIRNSNFPMHFIIFKLGVEDPYYQSIVYTNNFPYAETYFPIDIELSNVYIELYYHNNKKPKRFPPQGFKTIDVGEIVTVTNNDI